MEALLDKLEGPRILVVRGLRVILDEDLAGLYGVTTKALKQAVKRNPRRFPGEFVVNVEDKDVAILRSQNVTSSWGGSRYQRMAFTEHGALMVASVLNSDRAIDYLRVKRDQRRSDTFPLASVTGRTSNGRYSSENLNETGRPCPSRRFGVGGTVSAVFASGTAGLGT